MKISAIRNRYCEWSVTLSVHHTGMSGPEPASTSWGEKNSRGTGNYHVSDTCSLMIAIQSFFSKCIGNGINDCVRCKQDWDL